MEEFFIEAGDFDHICDSEYQISNVTWKETVKHIIPEGAKHLVINGGDNSVGFWDDTSLLKSVKVVAITLEDGVTLTKES